MQQKFKHIFNFDALSTAFERVKANRGCAGVDGVTMDMFKEELQKNLSRLEHELKKKLYIPLPLLELLVDKGNGEARNLCIPSVSDRIVQAAVLHFIEPILEHEFEDCSFAYRKGRSVRQAVYKIKEYYDNGYRWVIDADIDAFFDSVDHRMLVQKVKKYIKDQYIVSLIELWIKAEIWDGKTIKVMDKGIPQGSPISPILANLFLDELDEAMLKQGYKYVRYADDFIILCKTPEKAKTCLEFTKTVLDRLFLKLDEANIVSFEHGFEYLGVTFVRSLIMTPFDKPERQKKVLHFPTCLNMDIYWLKKKKGW